MDRKLPLLTHWVDPIPDRRETSTYWKHLLSSRRPPLRISLMGVALKCYKSFPWYWKNLSTVIVILKTSYKAPHSDCHQSFKYHIGKFPLPNDSSKFSRSHAAALWNTLRIWYLVLFLSLSQDTWTRSPCSFYYYGPGNGATKQHCLPRWLAKLWFMLQSSPLHLSFVRGKMQICQHQSVSIPVLRRVVPWTQGVLPSSNIVSLFKQHGLHMSTTIYGMKKISHEKKINIPFPWALFLIHPCILGEVLFKFLYDHFFPCLFDICHNLSKGDFKQDPLDSHIKFWLFWHTREI